jgi:hypothetical protein
MTEPTPSPYTGRSDAVPAAPAPAAPPAAPATPRLAVRHSRILMLTVAIGAAVAAIVTYIGSTGFPSAAPVEGLYAFGLIVDLVSIAIIVGVLTLIDHVQRGTSRAPGLPLDTRLSVFAIVAVVLSAIAVACWAIGGGAEQLLNLLTGTRGRYMYHTGGLVLAGIPWVLGLVFGTLGFRPGGNRLTNILALVAVGLGGVLAIVTTIASVVYGLGLSD